MGVTDKTEQRALPWEHTKSIWGNFCYHGANEKVDRAQSARYGDYMSHRIPAGFCCWVFSGCKLLYMTVTLRLAIFLKRFGLFYKGKCDALFSLFSRSRISYEKSIDFTNMSVKWELPYHTYKFISREKFSKSCKAALFCVTEAVLWLASENCVWKINTKNFTSFHRKKKLFIGPRKTALFNICISPSRTVWFHLLNFLHVWVNYLIIFSVFHWQEEDYGSVVIKMDTGMSRNGCQPEELDCIMEVSVVFLY